MIWGRVHGSCKKECIKLETRTGLVVVSHDLQVLHWHIRLDIRFWDNAWTTKGHAQCTIIISIPQEERKTTKTPTDQEAHNQTRSSFGSPVPAAKTTDWLLASAALTGTQP